LANSAESVGQLLANSALMKGERELLRKRDEPQAETSAPAVTRPSAEPIANDSKVISAVLLTLLDEQLQADAALAAVARSANGNSEADASKRVAAKYASDGLIPGDDLIAPQPSVQPELARAAVTQTPVSSDLQTFMQRFAAVVSGRPAILTVDEAGPNLGARENAPVSFGAVSTLRIAGFAAGFVWLAVLVIEWVTR
jgi:hypothetical protein